MIAFRKANANAELRHDVRKKCVGGSVELRDGDDIRAAAGKVQDGKVQRGLSAGDAQCANAALECGYAPLEHVARRVADSAVAVSFNFEIEQRRAVLGAVERVRDRLVNGHGDGFSRRIDFVATVDGDGLVAHLYDSLAAEQESLRACFM